jgi:phosphoglucosamine mutase
MPGKRKYFGTDGIRGLVGTPPITPEFALKLGWAVGKALAHPGAKVIIGKDTRRSGYMFESALEAGLTAAGMDVFLLGPMPTPGVAYLTRTLLADVGVVISASHNPHYDNGIKFFSRDGSKLDDATESKIEEYLDMPLTVVAPHAIGKVKRIDDGDGRYIEFCKSSLPAFQRLDRLKIVVDCANGATYNIAPNVFKELGAEVIAINNHPDGLNINLECGSTHPESLRLAVLGYEANVGIALDGDGDRIIMIDHEGNTIDGDQILYLLAKEGLRKGCLRNGGVVGTLMSNLALEIALKREGIDFVRAKVGDRYVMEMLREKKWSLGGEASGHIIWLGSTTTGDGVVAALQVLAIMQETRQTLPELLADLSLFPQVIKNVVTTGPLSESLWARIFEQVKVVETRLADRGRVLVRPSGTEPLIRIMVEGENQADINTFANELSDFIENLQKSQG